MYYSGRNDSFEEFIQEFEAYADARGLTDQQRAEAIVHCVAPSMHDSWKSLDPFDVECGDEWSEHLQYLTDIFGRSTPRHEAMRQRVFDFVQMFLATSKNLVLARHLTAEERDIVFFQGFHPDDHRKLLRHLISKAPYQSNHHMHHPLFYFENVFMSACAAFAQEPVQGLEQPPAGLKLPNMYSGLHVVRHAPTSIVETGTGRRAQSEQPKLVSTPIPPPTSNPTPIPTRPVTPCSRSEHLPGLSRPIASSPPSQQLNDPGERDPQPHRVDMDAGPLVGTPSDSSPTPSPSPLPTHPLPPPDPLPASKPPLPAPLPAHSPPPPDSLLASLPLPPTPLPARCPPLSDLPPTSSPPPPMPLPTHSPPLTDPLPAPLRPPPSPIPVHSLLPSGLLPTSSPPLLLFVRPPSSPPPPSVLLASPEQVANPALISYRNPPSHFTVLTDLRSPRPPQSPTLPISATSPHSPPPRPPDTMLSTPLLRPEKGTIRRSQRRSGKAKANLKTTDVRVTTTGSAYPSLDAPSHCQHPVRTAILTAAIGTSTREDPAVASLTTLVLRHPDLLLHLVWIPRDEELEGQNVAHLRAQEAARLDPPDQPHLRSAAFQKRRAREEAFHSWAFDWYLARVEGQWRELTRGLPPEGHAHTHVHLRPPDGNNHPLWSAAIDCAPPPRPSNSRSTTRSPAPMLDVSDVMVLPPPSPVPVDGGFATLHISSRPARDTSITAPTPLFPTSKGAKRLMALIQLSHAGFQPEQGPLPANVVPPLDVPLEPD
ncbi:hypothetical protein EDB85DRAFT_2156743 [Lactarius pseudohatsudake]|nr:hypothetical protein EDB85DRAFT_2156743 [Lactarius pseudohatsudake]